MKLFRPLVIARNIFFSYLIKDNYRSISEKQVLKGCSLDVYEGEILGIVGRNGAGKSTLLKILARTLYPNSGHLLNNAVSTELLSIGVGFDSRLTGRENIIMSGLLRGFRRREIEHRIKSIVELAGAEHYVDEPLYTYSSGMRARLGFATAVQSEPALLLIDETLGVGDKAFRKMAKVELDRLFSEGRTCVLVSHSPSAILSHCSRVAWIDGGVVRESGDPQIVMDKFNNAS